MAAGNLFFIQAIVLLLGLGALGLALSATHLLIRVLGWAGFQTAVLLFGVSSLSPYHGQMNPYLLTLLAVLVLASLIVLFLMLLLSLGVLKRQGSFETQEGGKR